MNDDRFDRLVRSIRGQTSRRTLNRIALAAAVGGGTAFGFAAGPVAGKCVKLGKRCRKGDRCCGGAKCKSKTCVCTAGKQACAGSCVDPSTDPANCGACGLSCTDGACVHGACVCDPFHNHCPNEIDGQCGCGAFVTESGFAAACTDRNSACNLDKPCTSNADCDLGSVCLRGCADPPAPNPNRCSKPCIPV
jgi:hypothetical protein